MKRLGIEVFWLLISVAVLLAVGGAVWLLKVGLPFKRQYNAMRGQFSEPYKVRPLAELRTVQLADVWEHWTCRVDDTNRVSSALSGADLTPSVSSWPRNE